MCVASTPLFYGSATKYFTSVCVNPIIFKMKSGEKKKKKKPPSDQEGRSMYFVQ